MALTGHLSDLSLSELIEFFCNQRKQGLLCVHYPQGSGCFYLQHGSVVDAKIGVLRGIDAVYYALTLPNAGFEFNATAEINERTINQPWAQVVLEGLRRLDEGIDPEDAFPEGVEIDDADLRRRPIPTSDAPSDLPSFMGASGTPIYKRPFIAGAAAAAVLISVAAIGVPAGWYGRSKPALAKQTDVPIPTATTPPVEVREPAPRPTPRESPSDAAALAAKRQHEKDQREQDKRERDRKAREDRANAAAAAQPTPASNASAKKATVQVTYDESGRVVQASGGDPTALRIARQRRFPPGKGGTATITIPMN